MSMLAERRTKQKWSLNPRGKHWTEDQNKFGQKLMEKMGWSSGKGLGRHEDGITESIKVSYKNDSKGMGFKEKDNQWTEHEDQFSTLLNKLSSIEENIVTKTPVKLISLVERSERSRVRVHYRKFTKGKDLTQYSEKDLANVFGRKQLQKPEKEPEKPAETAEETTGTEHKHGVMTIMGGSMVDYFKKKFPIAQMGNRGYTVGSNGVLKKESDSESERPSFGFGFKSNNSEEQIENPGEERFDSRNDNPEEERSGFGFGSHSSNPEKHRTGFGFVSQSENSEHGFEEQRTGFGFASKRAGLGFIASNDNETEESPQVKKSKKKKKREATNLVEKPEEAELSQLKMENDTSLSKGTSEMEESTPMKKSKKKQPEEDTTDSTPVEVKKKKKKAKNVENEITIDAEVELESNPKKKCKKKRKIEESESKGTFVSYISENGLSGKKRKLEEAEERTPKKKKKGGKSDDNLGLSNPAFDPIFHPPAVMKHQLNAITEETDDDQKVKIKKKQPIDFDAIEVVPEENNESKENSLCDSVSKKKKKRKGNEESVSSECNGSAELEVSSSGSKKKKKKVKELKEGGGVENACFDSMDDSRLEDTVEENPYEVIPKKKKKKSKNKDKAESIEESETPKKKPKKNKEGSGIDNPGLNLSALGDVAFNTPPRTISRNLPERRKSVKFSDTNEEHIIPNREDLARQSELFEINYKILEQNGERQLKNSQNRGLVNKAFNMRSTGSEVYDRGLERSPPGFTGGLENTAFDDGRDDVQEIRREIDDYQSQIENDINEVKDEARVFNGSGSENHAGVEICHKMGEKYKRRKAS